MTTTNTTRFGPADVTKQAVGVIDTDVHTTTWPSDPAITKHLSRRWADYVDMFGVRMAVGGGERPRHRKYAHRIDSVPDECSIPGTDPAFVNSQLLDGYNLTAAILNDYMGFTASGAGALPREFALDLARAFNDYHRETWLDSDPRWRCSITVPYEVPAAAVREIERCRAEMAGYGERWVQVLLSPHMLRPAGSPTYWPIFEACEQYGIPVGFHVAGATSAPWPTSPSGDTNYYYEEHCDFALFNFPLVASFIFEGVFDRFPGLRVALVELAWSWAIPYAWRLDHAYSLFRDEVPHLARKPSEYLAEHFWFSSQPLEEAEDRPFTDLYEALVLSGMGDKLMYSSDYPHWDFDPPDVFPSSLPEDARRKILGETASALYGISLTASA
jgi:predicted TIM-barrel fold metal-dependent hydrolase